MAWPGKGCKTLYNRGELHTVVGGFCLTAAEGFFFVAVAH
jgi:hypothetical protein